MPSTSLRPSRRALLALVVVLAVAVPAVASAAKPGASSSTTTTVACSPNPLHENGSGGAATGCTATVSGSHGPTGTVTFSAPSGTVSPSSCVLSSGSCTVGWTPSAPGTTTITASYTGGGGWQPSSGTADVAVRWASSTSVSCSPSTTAIGSTVTCRALVTSGGGAPADGLISWSTSGSGSFGAPSCASAHDCSVAYTTGSTAQTATITASYDQSSAYDPSQGSATVTSSGRRAVLTTTPFNLGGASVTAQWCSDPWASCYPLRAVGADAGLCVARLTDAETGAAVVGATLTFSGGCLGTATTDARGIASRAVAGPRWACSVDCAHLWSYSVSFAGDATYAPVSA